MSKPSYIMAIADAEALSLSLAKQIKNKTKQEISNGILSQCLAKMHDFDNFPAWSKDFRKHNQYSGKEEQLLRGKFISMLGDLGRMIVAFYENPRRKQRGIEKTTRLSGCQFVI